MTLNDFLEHWGLAENPFRGEEARADNVFARMEMSPGAHALRGVIAAPTSAAAGHPVYHSDFDKIVGDLRHPASSVVFGEKGSGKTAIRLQLGHAVARHNASDADHKVLLVPYDDLNAVLDRIHDRAGAGSPLESLKTIRLVDHMDAVLHSVVPRLVDALLGHEPDPPLDLGEHPARALRREDVSLRRDALILQAAYDRPQQAALRTRLLRRSLRLWPSRGRFLSALLALVGPLLLAGVYNLFQQYAPDQWRGPWAIFTFDALIAAYLLFLFWLLVAGPLLLRRPGRRMRRQLRVIPRSHTSYAASLRRLPKATRDSATLPLTESDEARYAMLARLKRVLAALGYTAIILVVDRIDEPTLVSGDPDRMRAVVWPLLNNKFLQQEGLGVKLLLPIELRHSLFRESSVFFQEARLDKQNLVERLEWTGPMLFDLCEGRLAACTRAGRETPALMQLFEDDVTRQDAVDALDRMHQPRDAFKLLYRVLNEHCAGVTSGDRRWRIPRHVLLAVVKQETDRVQQLYRGIRPA